MGYDVFISYRRQNGLAIATMMRELLKSRGIRTFMDLDELRSGTFDDKLLDAIRSTPAFLLILPPGALDRCGEPDDWLTREITTALESEHCNIVPILCDGFEWPRTWSEDTPPILRSLSLYNSVTLSYDYKDAMVDRIIEYMKLPVSRPVAAPAPKTSLQSDIETFFRDRMQHLSDVKGIDLAFHAGSEWHENIDRLDILTDLADAGVRVRVIVNAPDAAETIGRHMRHKLKRYVSFSEAVALWKHFESAYDNVEVRISDIPLLRIYYSFHMADPTDDVVRVKYYTYGNAKINRNYAHNFLPSDSHFELYRAEFDFLWERAVSDNA